MPIHTANGTDC